MDTPETALYLYAFLDRFCPDDLPDRIAGRSGLELSLLRAGTVAALVAPVPVADFSGPSGECNLTDPDWVAARACHHESVVGAAMRVAPVFPAGFATLFSTEAGLRDFVAMREPAIAAFLEYVAGKEEWGLTASAIVDDLDVLQRMAARIWPDWESSSPGARYLRLCRDRAELVERVRADAETALTAILGEAMPETVESKPVKFRNRSTGDAWIIGKYALLVTAGTVERLRDRLDGLTRRSMDPPHLFFSLSGPWPPYRFRPSLSPEGRELA